MINDGQVFLAGYVTSTPTFKELASGTATATVRVAYTPRWLNRETGEWSDGPTSFVNVLCWRALADNVAMSLRKGEPVLVMGRLRVRRFQDKEGMQRTVVEIDANSVGHDLTRGVAHFSRTRRAAGEAAGAEGPATVTPSPQEDDDPGEASEPGQAGQHAEDSARGQMLDEHAVAELAREMSESLGEVAAPF